MHAVETAVEKANYFCGGSFFSGKSMALMRAKVVAKEGLVGLEGRAKETGTRTRVDVAAISAAEGERKKSQGEGTRQVQSETSCLLCDHVQTTYRRT